MTVDLLVNLSLDPDTDRQRNLERERKERSFITPKKNLSDYNFGRNLKPYTQRDTNALPHFLRLLRSLPLVRFRSLPLVLFRRRRILLPARAPHATRHECGAVQFRFLLLPYTL